MAFAGTKPSLTIPPTASMPPANGDFRTRSIATRLTEGEFAEVESAATQAGQKVAEWLRDAALSQSRAKMNQDIDSILLTEIVGMRALMLNLFAKASEGPLSKEDLRKISQNAEAIKEQKAEEVLLRRQRNGSQIPGDLL
jgi:hypothetical protein